MIDKPRDTKKTYPRAIKNWPEDERPREKLFRSGEHTLSNTELLAILLRTGVKGESAVDVARKIMQKFKTFRNMSHTDIRDWAEFKGVGKAKIAQLRAAMEIARRFDYQEKESEGITLKHTEDVVELFKSRMRDLKNEVVKAIFCDARNKVIEVFELSEGTPTESHPVIQKIISRALQNFATGIICIHNHPFGKPAPSRQDDTFTTSLREAARLMDMKLLDHVIFGEKSYYSFDRKTTSEY